MYQSFYENTRLYVFLILCSMIQPIAYVYILDSRYLAIYCNIIMVSNFIIMFLLEFINWISQIQHLCDNYNALMFYFFDDWNILFYTRIIEFRQKKKITFYKYVCIILSVSSYTYCWSKKNRHKFPFISIHLLSVTMGNWKGTSK